MSSDKQIEAAKKFVASLTGEYSMPADAYVALAELRQALAAHEAEKQAGPVAGQDPVAAQQPLDQSDAEWIAEWAPKIKEFHTHELRGGSSVLHPDCITDALKKGLMRGLDCSLASRQAADYLPNLAPVIAWLEAGCDVGEAVKELRIYQSKLQAKANPHSESDKAGPVAWLNYPCITDAAGNFIKHGEPELGFRRLAYGYDADKAVALYTAPPSPLTEQDKADAELTDEEILACRRFAGAGPDTRLDRIAFGRAVLRAARAKKEPQ